MVAASTRLFATASAFASCEPVNSTRPKYVSGSMPILIRPAFGNRWPEVEDGSTNAKVRPLRSAIVLMPLSTRVMIWL